MKRHRLRGALLIAGFVSTLLVCYRSSDTQEKLQIYGPVHVYRSETPPCSYPGTDFIAVITPKDKVEVTQVIQKTNYIAVKIRLPDSREGWVFSGESMELYEPNCHGPNFRAC